MSVECQLIQLDPARAMAGSPECEGIQQEEARVH